MTYRPCVHRHKLYSVSQNKGYPLNSTNEHKNAQFSAIQRFFMLTLQVNSISFAKITQNGFIRESIKTLKFESAALTTGLPKVAFFWEMRKLSDE